MLAEATFTFDGTASMNEHDLQEKIHKCFEVEVFDYISRQEVVLRLREREPHEGTYLHVESLFVLLDELKHGKHLLQIIQLRRSWQQFLFSA